MAADQSEDEDVDRKPLFHFATRLWQDKTLRKAVGGKLGVTTTNFWLFCHDLEQRSLDPKRLDDPDYWEDFLEDVDDRMKGGKREDRDIRRGKPNKFWRWAEDEKKDEMSRRTGEPIPPDHIERWYKEWQNFGEPDGWGRQISKPLD
jgi:hypothetical protein